VSQPELVAALRSGRPSAPPELRERVRMLAADATVPPRRRLTWRRALVIAVPVAAAIAAAAVLLPRGGKESATTTTAAVERAATPKAVDNGAAAGASTSPLATAAAPTRAAEAYGALPAPSTVRPQRYSATLALRLRDAAAVSAAGKRATAIVASLGGYPSSLNLEAGGESGYATLVFRVPRGRVQTAVSRLSALGTIVAENVRIEDLGGRVSSVDRKLARLRKARTEAKAVEPQTPEAVHRIAVLTAQIQKLRRGKAATLRAAGYATVTVRLTTPTAAAPVAKDGHGPLHGLAVAFRWLWIGAVYALALGLPFVLLGLGVWLVARSVRRRRVDALLSRS
jgi:hypothetical protein